MVPKNPVLLPEMAGESLDPETHKSQLGEEENCEKHQNMMFKNQCIRNEKEVHMAGGSYPQKSLLSIRIGCGGLAPIIDLPKGVSAEASIRGRGIGGLERSGGLKSKEIVKIEPEIETAEKHRKPKNSIENIENHRFVHVHTFFAD